MSFVPLGTLGDVDRMLADLQVPGMSLAWSSGDEVHAQTWGSAQGDRPVDGGTLFQAASVAKPIIAYAALRLARGGSLDLDADVNTVLTSWRVPPVDDWQPVVTTRMLLSHLTGAGDSTGGGYKPAADPVSMVEGLGGSNPFRMFMVPNLMASYSPAGYVLIAQILCDATGLDLQQTMERLVFEPLAMPSTTFEQPLPDALRPRAAHGHRAGAELDGGWLNSPVALWTTPTDLVRLGRAINSGAEPGMLRGQPLEPRMGLGVFLTSHEGVDWWSHGGSCLGYECTLVGSTSAPNFVGAAMSNASEGTLLVLDALRVVSTQHGPGPIVLRHISADGRIAWARMTAINTQAAGEYAIADGVTITLETTPKPFGQNELLLVLPGQPPIELARVKDGVWRVPGFNTYLEFDAPDVVRFLQGGRELRAERARS